LCWLIADPRAAALRAPTGARGGRGILASNTADIEDAVNEAIEAASTYVSLLPAGQKAWGEKEYNIAEPWLETLGHVARYQAV
jgi:hypothetical protein